MIGEAIIAFVAEVVAQVVVVFIFRYPGALVVQAITGFRKPYDYWLNERAELSGWVGVLSLAAIILVASQW